MDANNIFDLKNNVTVNDDNEEQSVPKICDLPENYLPTDDNNEEYMNDRQREFFRRQLLQWKNDLNERTKRRIETLEETNLKDLDTAMQQDFAFREDKRCEKVAKKIQKALKKIATGDYGYCDVTGEPIGLGRLMARPIADLSVAAQEEQERIKKSHRSN